MKIVSVIGARPQFIKAAAISRKLRTRHHEVLVHTGQHYDSNMSCVFFEEPDWVLVYGDTNSTLAGALAAVKLHRNVVHIEAGLRSFNRSMPEEINRVLTDHISNVLFCPSQIAVENLAREGIHDGVHLVGDVMLDVLLHTKEQAGSFSKILEQIGVKEKGYLIATIHRAENTDNLDRLSNIVDGLTSLDEIVIIPLHPRTRKVLQKSGLINNFTHDVANIRLLEPVGYMDMVRLQQSARMILTDSGGMQKEAYWLHVPCLTLREETEWTETVEAGWNILVGASKDAIIENVCSFKPPLEHPQLYGDGLTSQRCVDLLSTYS
ncbi:MAG: non-hydrolyzing UDP-N-acetylglucosamine 2-epimerase [Candidatus Thorarchaeota archaeon]